MVVARAGKIIGATPSNGGGASPRLDRVPTGSSPAAAFPTVVDVTRPAETPVATAFTALARFWLWGWAGIGLLTLDLLLGLLYFILPLLALIGIVTAPVFLIGVPFLLFVLIVSQGLTGFERARVFALTGFEIPAPARVDDGRPRWKRLLLTSRPWRALLYLTTIMLWGWLAGAVALGLISVALSLALAPLYWWALPAQGFQLPWARLENIWWLPLLCLIGLVGLVVVPLLARGLALVDVVLARWLLGPDRVAREQQLTERVDTLTQTRVATVDSVEVERRRIERDLHDGPQQRLVAIAMDLGMAQERIDRDPAGARSLLDKAHAASKEAITEMRMVARGIHPPVLTDRGLDAALSALAARSPVPVGVQVDLSVRPSPTVEAIAYFCVSEALTNVAKHSRANAAQVQVSTLPGENGPSALQIQISDDGVGGADPSQGTGLHGLVDRVRAIDGSLAVRSPTGGPTVLTVNLPWSSS
jgi:signal transduction histidine kinase